MLLYFVNGTKFVGTQTEAKEGLKKNGASYNAMDVPIDKAGLVAFLNSLLTTKSMKEAQKAVPDQRTDKARLQAILDRPKNLLPRDYHKAQDLELKLNRGTAFNDAQYRLLDLLYDIAMRRGNFIDEVDNYA